MVFISLFWLLGSMGGVNDKLTIAIVVGGLCSETKFMVKKFRI